MLLDVSLFFRDLVLHLDNEAKCGKINSMLLASGFLIFFTLSRTLRQTVLRKSVCITYLNPKLPCGQSMFRLFMARFMIKNASKSSR